MVTDIEMGAMEELKSLCKDKFSKDILEVATDMLGALDTDYYSTSDEKRNEFLREYGDEINDIVNDAVMNNRLPKKKVGDWEVINSFQYGDKEIFLGENPNAEKQIERYIVGDCVSSDLFVRYENVVGCDSYSEIAELYSQRVAEQVQRVKDSLAKFPYDRTPLGVESCDSIAGKDIQGEIIVVKPDVIKREYVGADRQLCVATGGNGCFPDGHGTKVYCKNIFTGNETYWHRHEILGTLKSECVPEWVKDRITDKPIEVLFTFGSWEGFPFQMGYVSITAPSVKEAIAEFRRNWPDKTEDCLNCSDYYYTPESVAKIMEHQNGAGCHKKIDITISPKVVSVNSLISKAEQDCETMNKNGPVKTDVDIEKE